MEAAPHPWPAIGSLMLRDGYVTKEQLEDVLHAQHDSPQQRISGWRLGELLVERGFMTQGQVAQLVAEQYELPYIDLDESRIDRSVAHLLPSEMVDRFSALPIESGADGSLVLAVSDPATVLFSDELRRTLGRPLRFTVVAADAMERAVASVRDEAPPERAGRSIAEWPSGAPAFDFARDETADAGADADEVSPDGTTAQAPSCPPLGTLLVRDGLLTEDELEGALAEQRLSQGKRLGEILVERGTLRRADVARVVAEQYELPFIDLSSFELDHRVGALLPRDIAQRHSALPLDFLADGSLRVAVADPTKVLAPEEILAVLGARLSFAVADPDAVEAAIEQLEEHASASADAWAGFAPVGPPTSGSDERPHVDASDLIIVPTEEVVRAEVETVERRGDPSGTHEDALVLASSEGTTFAEAGLHAPSIGAPEPEPDKQAPAQEQAATAEAAAGLGSSAPAEPVAQVRPSKKRRRSWFRRRRHDAVAETAAEIETAADGRAEAPSADDTGPADPITGLLLAGEASADGDATSGDPSSRATEQAAVLRLWIAGDAAPTADAPDSDAAAEAELTFAEDHESPTEALLTIQPDAVPPDDLASVDDGPTLAGESTEHELAFAEHDEGFSGLVDDERIDDVAPARPLIADAELEPPEPDAFEPTLESSWTDATEATESDEPALAHAGLPEVVEAFVEPAATDGNESYEGEAQAEAWNIFAPTPVAEELEAPGEGDDEAPAELRDESEHDESEHDDVAHEAHAPAEETFDAALSDEPGLGQNAWHEPVEAAWDDEPAQDQAAEVTAAADEPQAEASLDAEVTADEQETAPTQPSWLSWEPAASAADPWREAETDDDADTAEPVAETAALAEDPSDSTTEPWTPSPEDVQADPVALTDESLTHEPDAPDEHEASWELEDVGAPTAELEPSTFEHTEDAAHGEPFAPGISDDEPSALDVLVGMSAPEAADDHFQAPAVELDVVEEPAEADLVPAGLAAAHVDRGTLAPLVERATALGASTVHFSAQEHGIVVRARIDGVLRRLDTVTGQARFELGRELGLAAQSGSIAGGHVTSLPTPHGDTVTIRFRPSGDAATLDTLSLDPADREALERALRHPFGLVLVAGPAGSGQATTLSAALHELTSTDRAVMTIEDPILHVVPGADQVAVDSSAGRGFADGLHTILGADPDAILVGELADEETARLAVDAATGHLVVSTVLAQTAVGALDRLSLLGVDTDLVASTLSLVVAQRLVRRLCDHCREGYYASAADTVALRRPEDEIGRRLLARGTGCAECGDTGFSGTIGAYEVLAPNDEVRALVAANAPAAELERAARLAGKRTLADDAVRLCLEGLTTVSEVQRVLGRTLL